jgi:hypothetical protein
MCWNDDKQNGNPSATSFVNRSRTISYLIEIRSEPRRRKLLTDERICSALNNRQLIERET